MSFHRPFHGHAYALSGNLNSSTGKSDQTICGRFSRVGQT